MRNLTSLETRQQIKQLSEQGLSSPKIAGLLGVSVRVVRKWRHRLQKGGAFILRWDDLLV